MRAASSSFGGLGEVGVLGARRARRARLRRRPADGRVEELGGGLLGQQRRRRLGESAREPAGEQERPRVRRPAGPAGALEQLGATSIHSERSPRASRSSRR